MSVLWSTKELHEQVLVRPKRQFASNIMKLWQWNTGWLRHIHQCLCSSSSPSAEISWFHDMQFFTFSDKWCGSPYGYEINKSTLWFWKILWTTVWTPTEICNYWKTEHYFEHSFIWRNFLLLDLRLENPRNFEVFHVPYIRVKKFCWTTLLQILLVQNPWYNFNFAVHWRVI